jgi:hypothetical protein
MTSLSIFTSMTNPKERNDPWEEALMCYEDLADEVVVVGDDWPSEFKWDHIGETFQKGLDKCNSDWVIRMDIDYFFHENNFSTIRNALNRFKEFPVLSFPQYQIFTPDRYQIKTRLCLAFNKKKYPNIQLNGGGDLTLATLDNKLLDPNLVPNINVPIYQYDSVFRTREIISHDRARFARAWVNYFGSTDDRGGVTEELAYKAWWKMINDRYPKHTFKLQMNQHPVYIQNKLASLEENQFGYKAFGLKEVTSRSFIDFLKGYREKYINPILLEKYKYINTYSQI